MAKLKVLLLGDIVGAPGLAMFEKHLPALREKYQFKGLIVNGENSAQGKGITPRIADLFKKLGVNVITTGNHIWRRKEIYGYIDENHNLLRPINFPSQCPGVGATTFSCGSTTVGVINVQGRVFMADKLSCPFRAAESAVALLKRKTNIIFVDMHAEATSEKAALANYLDGKVTGVVGTHTHVPTSDERILPNGTAYVSDLGMAGALNSVIGVQKGAVINAFLTSMPNRFSVETAGPGVMSGVCITFNPVSGKAEDIERVHVVDNNLQFEGSA
jgi:2',3'-cyclic-nucleotide 2'-phosphodiesterase